MKAYWVAVVCGMVVWAAAEPVLATHEVDHRFVVSGTVREPGGSPRQDVEVVVEHPRSKSVETALTDRNGGYSVLLHLHDQDAGDQITVTVGEERKTIRAEFDPSDHRTPRTQQVNFGGPADTAAPEESPSPLMWYVVGGVVVAGIFVAVLRRKSGRGRVSPSRRGGTSRRKGKSRG